MRGCTITTFVIVLLAATLTDAAPQPKRKSKGIPIPLTKRSSSIFLHPDNTVNFDAVEAHAASVSAYVVDAKITICLYDLFLARWSVAWRIMKRTREQHISLLWNGEGTESVMVNSL
jgi:hypothetical protein